MHHVMKMIEESTEKRKEALQMAQCAAKCKESHRSLSDMYRQIAEDNAKHNKMILDEAEKMVADKRRQGHSEDKDKLLIELHDHITQKMVEDKKEIERALEGLR